MIYNQSTTAVPLYRAQSTRHLLTPVGKFRNPYADRERKPRDTDIELHAAFGTWFRENFGVNYRSQALICTGNRSIAEGYVTGGSALIEVTPLAPYSICFSPRCLDLFGHFQFGGRDLRENLDKVGLELESLEFVEYRNDGLDEAAASGHEVMVYADYFAYRRLS